MSVRVQTYVWQLELEPGEKLVALAMADHCHDDGSEARPSRATIAKKCGFSERQVIRNIQKLMARGVIVLDRAATQHKTNVYQFVLPDNFAMLKSGGKPVDNPVDNAHSGVTFETHSGVTSQNSGVTFETPEVTFETSGVTFETLRGDVGVTLTIREPSLEPSEEPSPLSSADERRVKKSPQAKPFADEFAQLWEVYPRRVDAGRAYKQVAARLRAGVPFDELMVATINYAEARRGQPNEYTKHAATFYGSSECWKDFLPDGAALIEMQQAKQPAIFGALSRFLAKD